MIAAPIPDNEPERLRALRRYDVPGGVPREAFGRILQLVVDILELPMASISFIGELEQVAKVSLNAEPTDMPRSMSLCAWAILKPEVMVIPDLWEDERFSDHPMAAPSVGVRCYVSAPITTPDGVRIGTLCAADARVHDLSVRERSILASLAQLVMDELELRLRERELEQAASYARVLVGVSGLGEQELPAGQMAVRAAELISEVIDLDWVALVEVRSGLLKLRSEWNTGKVNSELERVLRLGVSPEQGLIAESLKRQAAVFVDHYASQPTRIEALVDAGLGGVVCLYLTDTGGLPQLLLAIRQQQDTWTSDEQALFRASARSLRLALERQQRMQEMQRAAYTDALTGLGNRRAFGEALQLLGEGGLPYSVVMIDLDGMKTINDTLGHAEGDLLLQTFARQLIRGLHESDHAYRLGGDEFALLLSDLPTNPVTLDKIIRERLERTVRRTRAGGFPGVDASLGWACVPRQAQSGGQALELADQRMYQQKASRGRRNAPVGG